MRTELSVVEWILLCFLTVTIADTCTNVASDKSTGYNTVAGLHGVSGGSADGITNGLSYNEGGWSSCVHTSDWQTDPFVYVDLEAEYEINRVTIESGPAYTNPWSGNMKIVVSNTILDSVSEFDAASVCATVPSDGFTAEYDVDEFWCDSPITGRYVGYIVEGDDQIVMFCETEVFTTDCDTINPDADQCDTLDCNDGDSCTIDSCDTDLGCQYEAIDCDDGDVCTDDTCDSVEGCINSAKCASDLVCDGVTGNCTRDCSSFQIDEFLLDCSLEFGYNEYDISELQGSVDTINGRLDELDDIITVINGELTYINSDVSGNSDDITTVNSRLDTKDGEITAINDGLAVIELDIYELQSEETTTDAITAINTQISYINDEISAITAHLDLYTAHSEGKPSIENIVNDKDNDSLILTDNKDILIICLLVSNIFTSVGALISCCLLSKSKFSKYSKYANVNAYSSVDENQHLQS